MTERITYTTQTGKPGSCFLAQIFDANGKSMATIDAMPNPEHATARARRLAACLNACVDEDTQYLESVVELGTTLRKVHGETLATKELYQRELCNMERERDSLKARLSELEKDLNAVIAKVKGAPS